MRPGDLALAEGNYFRCNTECPFNYTTHRLGRPRGSVQLMDVMRLLDAGCVALPVQDGANLLQGRIDGIDSYGEIGRVYQGSAGGLETGTHLGEYVTPSGSADDHCLEALRKHGIIGPEGPAHGVL